MNKLNKTNTLDNNINLLRIKYTIKDYINYLNDYLNKNFNISCSV